MCICFLIGLAIGLHWTSSPKIDSQSCYIENNFICPNGRLYKDMSSIMRDIFIHSYVIFQGRRVTLLSLYGVDSQMYYAFTKEDVKKIFESHMVIGEELKEAASYIERKFTSKSGGVPMAFEEIAKKLTADNAFILADDIGSGKTTTIKMLAIHLKKIYPTYWISAIDSKNLKPINFNTTTTKSTVLSILNLNPTFKKHFNELYERKQVILIWDNPQVLYQYLILFESLKDFGIIQLFATYDGFSQNIEAIFDLNPEIYRFGPTKKGHYSSFIRDLSKNQKTETETTVNHIEEYLNSEIVTNDYHFISKNHPLFINLMIPSAIKEDFINNADNLYYIYENYLKIKGSTFNFNLNYRTDDINSISSGTKLDWKEFNDEKARKELFNAIKNLNYKEVEIIHSSLESFIIFQFIYESLSNADNLDESQVQLTLNLLIYFSNFYDDKIVWNLVNTTKIYNVHKRVKDVIQHKFKDILLKFDSTENPSTFVKIFHYNNDILTSIGTPYCWLELKFNLYFIKNFTSSLYNPNVYELFIANEQKGKIFFILWQNRHFLSINAILEFTKVEIEKEFLVKLLSKTDFERFFDLVKHNALSKEEFRKLFLNYNLETTEYYKGRTAITDKICNTFIDDIFDQTEIKKFFPQLNGCNKYINSTIQNLPVVPNLQEQSHCSQKGLSRD